MAEKHTPQNREEWKALRRRFLGSSAIGCLVDAEHPYETPLKLWNEYTGKVARDDDLDSAVLERGREMEPLAAKRLARAMPGVNIEHNTDNAYWCDPILRIGATPDTIVHDPNRGKGPVELKNPHPYFYARNWVNGEPPLWMALQVLTAAKLMDAEWAAIGALRVGHKIEFDLTEIPLHDGAWQALLDAAGEFWRCVETDTPPVPNYARDLAVISAMYPTDDGTAIDLSGDNELINALVERERVKEMIKAAQDNCDAYDALIKHKAGVHELIIAGDYRCVLKTQQVAGYTVKPRVQRSLRIKKLARASEARSMTDIVERLHAAAPGSERDGERMLDAAAEIEMLWNAVAEKNAEIERCRKELDIAWGGWAV